VREIEINFPKIKWPKFFKKRMVRKEIEELQFNLENYPEDWELNSTKRSVIHNKTGIVLWMANGWQFLDFYSALDAFTAKEQKYLGKSVNKIINKKVPSKGMGATDFQKLMKQINKWGVDNED